MNLVFITYQIMKCVIISRLVSRKTNTPTYTVMGGCYVKFARFPRLKLQFQQLRIPNFTFLKLPQSEQGSHELRISLRVLTAFEI